MNSKLENLEIETLQLVTSLLDSFDKKLKQSGITRKTIKLKKDIGKTGYLSEIEVGFWEENNLFDVMEFFVVENNAPSDSLDGTKKWVEDFLNNLIRERET